MLGAAGWRGRSCAARGRLLLRSPIPLLSLLMIAVAAPRRHIPIPPTPMLWSTLVRQRSVRLVVALPVSISSPLPPHVSVRTSRYLLVLRGGIASVAQLTPVAQLTGPWTPGRIIAIRDEGGGARPRATNEQFVGGGQGVLALPSRKGGMR